MHAFGLMLAMAIYANSTLIAQDTTIVNFFPYSEGDFWVQNYT